MSSQSIPWIGVNWTVDSRLHNYPKIFNNGVEPYLEDFFQENFSSQFSVRYPGGFYVQRFNCDPDEFDTDLYTPNPRVFYDFCKRANVKVLQQLPTTSFIKKKQIIGIFKVRNLVDWNIVEELINAVTKYCKWLISNDYVYLIKAFEIGNEDYSDIEGNLEAVDYVKIVSRYLDSLGPLFPDAKFIINARPAGKNNWGREVLSEIKNQNLVNKIFGAATHIYPGWSYPELSKPNINFHDYIFSDLSIFSKNKDYFLLEQSLNELEYPADFRIFITECALDLTKNGYMDNKKDFSAAIGLGRNIVNLVKRPRFGGLAYYALFHQYLIQNQNEGKSTDNIYQTKITDWGLGELWFFPDSKTKYFKPTPLLKILGVFSKFFSNSNNFSLLKTNDNLITLFSVRSDNQFSIIFINILSSDEKIDLNGDGSLIIYDGGLSARTVPLDSREVNDGSFSINEVSLSKSNGFNLPSFSIAYCILKSGKLNGVKIDQGLIGLKGVLDGKELNLGNYGIKRIGNKLTLFPQGAKISGNSLEQIIDQANLKNKLPVNVLSIITNWEISEE